MGKAPNQGPDPYIEMLNLRTEVADLKKLLTTQARTISQLQVKIKLLKAKQHD